MKVNQSISAIAFCYKYKRSESPKMKYKARQRELGKKYDLVSGSYDFCIASLVIYYSTELTFICSEI